MKINNKPKIPTLNPKDKMCGHSKVSLIFDALFYTSRLDS